MVDLDWKTGLYVYISKCGFIKTGRAGTRLHGTASLGRMLAGLSDQGGCWVLSLIPSKMKSVMDQCQVSRCARGTVWARVSSTWPSSARCSP